MVKMENGSELGRATYAVVFLMLTGCLSNPVSEEAKQQAMKAYMDCLQAAAAKMDDGKSDAMTIAMAIKPLCAGEFGQSVKLSGSGLSPYARNLFEERVKASQLELVDRIRRFDPFDCRASD
jgi:hypothetical protein